MSEDKFLITAKILKAQGIRGEVKAKILSDNFSRFKEYKTVFIGNGKFEKSFWKEYKIISVRIDPKGFAFLGLEGITDRNGAEEFKDKLIAIERDKAPALSNDTYYIADIVGCGLISDDGAELGKIIDVASYGAADVITAIKDGKELRFPFLNKIVKNIDIASGRFIVIKYEFDKVCVYDD